jgi:lipopolysaccharide heptosyltransferase III
MALDPSETKRILVIKPRAIGDVVLSTAVLKNLRDEFPAARIDFLTEQFCREVVEGNSLIDDVIVFDSKTESGLSLILRVRRRKYDLVFDLFGNPRTALVTFFSGALRRIGYRFKWRQYCYTDVVEPRGGEVHNVEFNLDALRAVGISPRSRMITFPLDRTAGAFADNFIKESGLGGKRLVALNPGGGWYTKRWPVRSYAGFGDRIGEEFGAVLLLVWGPGEEPMVREIQERMKARPVLIPRSTLKELGAVLKKCDALVTNDSGPMHIAAALGVAAVAIFGPTNPALQGPVSDRAVVVRKEDLDCLGCNLTKCPIGNPCMEQLSVEVVFGAFRSFVERYHIFT